MERSTTLPQGTITFLFTDIEASTRLWERQPEAMRLALARHDALLREVIEGHGGAVFKTFGDQFCAAFATAADALGAAVAAQRALHVQAWDVIGVLRVRMALHTGAAELRDGDYFGPPLNRVARLLDVGHGGQILLSLAAQELARETLPPESHLRDLGEHRLKDLAHPERVFQLICPDLPSDFPPLHTLDVRPNNLPAQPTPLLGREAAAAAVCELLRQGDVRLVTLTGPGGTGKTRLALQVAADLLDDFTDGVFFVDLAHTRDPQLLATVIAQTLGLRETEGRAVRERLRQYLRERCLLLLLDNFEQLLPAAPLVAELLAEAPRLKVLITSRTVLRLRGEKEVAVPPLPVPDPRRPPSVEALSQYAAVALFIQRARDVRPEFAVDNENAPAVAEICHRLDGLPLAIELAAARIKLLSPEALLARLGNRLRVLTGGARDLPARQQTLRDTIAWSYDLLDESEQRLFRRLAIFVGGFSLAAAESVCAADGDPASSGQAPVIDIFDAIASLVDKSLIRHEPDAVSALRSAGAPGRHSLEPRFGLLETIREYGRECLAASGELTVVSRRHAGFFLAMAAENERRYSSATPREEYLDRLDRERDNLRAALAWSLAEVGEEETALRLAGHLGWYWNFRGHWSEGRRWLTGALARSDPRSRTALRAKALRETALLAYHHGDLADAHALQTEAVAIWRELGERSELLTSLINLGWSTFQQGDIEAGRALLTESAAIAREIGDHWALVPSLNGLCVIAVIQGDEAAAWSLSEEAVSTARQVGDNLVLAWSLGGRGSAALARGDLAAAREIHEECLTAARRSCHVGSIVAALSELGFVARYQGDHEREQALCEERLAIEREQENAPGIADALNDLGYVAHARGDPDTARARLDESLAMRRALDDRAGIGWTLLHLAQVALIRGGTEEARAFLEESVAIWQERGDRQGLSYARHVQGQVAGQQGDPENARALHAESLALRRELRDRWSTAECLEGVAYAYSAEGEPARAARLLSAAAALRDALGTRLSPIDRPGYEVAVATARDALGETAFASAWREGEGMPLEKVIADALGEVDVPREAGGDRA